MSTIYSKTSDIDLRGGLKIGETEIDNEMLQQMLIDPLAYSGETTYKSGQYCSYNDRLFISLVNDNKGNLPTDSAKWKTMIEGLENTDFPIALESRLLANPEDIVEAENFDVYVKEFEGEVPANKAKAIGVILDGKAVDASSEEVLKLYGKKVDGTLVQVDMPANTATPLTITAAHVTNNVATFSGLYIFGAIKTSTGTIYQVEADDCIHGENTTSLNLSRYMTYDNLGSFVEPWYAYVYGSVMNDELAVDSAVANGSNSLITSGAVYTALLNSLGETATTAHRGDHGKAAYDHSKVAHAPSDAQKNSDITKAEIEAKLVGEIDSHTHAGDSSLTLGETSSDAYRGDRGKIAYDHSQVAHAPSDAEKNVPPTKQEVEAVLTGEISSHSHAYTSLELGITDTTAYRGDRGKIAYDHSKVAHAPSDAQKNSDITKAEIEAKLIGEIDSHTHADSGLTAAEVKAIATKQALIFG